MKYFLLFISLVFTYPILAQKRIEPKAYEKEMNQLGLEHIQFRLTTTPINSRVHAYKPYKWVKVTFKTGMNTNVTSKIKLAEMAELIENTEAGLDEIIDIGLSDLDLTDYVSIMSYDVRAKFYLRHNTALVLRCFVTGIQLDTYNYTIGFTHKF